MTDVEPATVVTRFNEAINARDADALAGLMTEDHASVDWDGTTVRGRGACLDLWREFFEGFPDYENVFESVTVDGEAVTVLGRSNCADVRLDGPAIWTAEVTAGKVAEWRVYEDTPENRRAVGLRDPSRPRANGPTSDGSWRRNRGGSSIGERAVCSNPSEAVGRERTK